MMGGAGSCPKRWFHALLIGLLHVRFHVGCSSVSRIEHPPQTLSHAIALDQSPLIARTLMCQAFCLSPSLSSGLHHALTGSFKVGTQSRSLTAAHVLVESGKFGSIKVLKGGVNGWAASERPIEEM